jgi:hypothetical protein
VSDPPGLTPHVMARSWPSRPQLHLESVLGARNGRARRAQFANLHYFVLSCFYE